MTCTDAFLLSTCHQVCTDDLIGYATGQIDEQEKLHDILCLPLIFDSCDHHFIISMTRARANLFQKSGVHKN